MTNARQALGRAGETIAAEFLEQNGYRILARRWRAAGREIDIVAQHRETVVFVEVKTRRERTAFDPMLAVDWRKQRQIVRAARIAAARWKEAGRSFRFDIVGVTLGPEGPRIDHLTDAFRADD